MSIDIDSDTALQIVNDLQHKFLLDTHPAPLFSQYPQRQLEYHPGSEPSGADDPSERDAHVPDLIERLDKLFHEDKNSYRKFLAHRGDSAQWLLDLLQDILDYEPNLARKNRCRLFKALIRLSAASQLYPRCFPLTGLEHETLVAGGTFGDVYIGSLRDRTVAVKIMRVFEQSDIDALLKGFGREALIWRQMSHPNLLPFYGLYYFQRRLCLVSPWMDNGHIRAFLKKETYCTDCLLSLILNVALGLEYLHGNGVVHGDLKGDNIFVTSWRRACLADFGFASIRTSMASIQFTSSSKRAQGGTARYQAPELHRGGDNDKLTDIYAFACFVYELLTGKAPFPELYSDVAVAMAVLEGRRPSRPQSCSGTPSLNGLWNLLQNCWRENPADRPTASHVVQILMGDDIQAIANESILDWDPRFTSKFRRLFLGDRPFPSVAEFEQVVFGSGQTK
ncbi:Protein kinase domain-containing protein [Mycena sanguinolenta]|uniref:Protein kinase domain-containing protein n=1 Tax=Mycena sanguinolenta TaxID=230812 RepID=A0A8H6ZDX3_9AGAR|nr:Protein kinase domain-containing protein [Mycena sanguinolenta]